MRRITSFFIVLSMFVAVTFVAAEGASVKIGFVDVQQVLNQSTKGKRAKDKLEQFIKRQQTSIDAKTDAIKRKREKLQKKASAMSSSAKEREEKELQSLFKEYREAAAKAQEDVRKKENELTGSILNEIRDIIVDMAKDGKYTVILERAAVLYATDKVDLTDKVIKKINSRR